MGGGREAVAGRGVAGDTVHHWAAPMWRSLRPWFSCMICLWLAMVAFVHSHNRWCVVLTKLVKESGSVHIGQQGRRVQYKW